MEEICLVTAGNYLLGINVSAIIGTSDVESFPGDEQSEQISLIHIESFLEQRVCTPSATDVCFVEVKSTAGRLVLQVDKIVAEVRGPEELEAIPLLYPELAGRCCPQIMIHDNQPALLLDMDGLQDVRAELNNEFGMIPPSACSKEEVVPERGVKRIDDRTFTQIVSWTIGEYLERGSQIPCAIRSAELPSDYRRTLQNHGGNDELVQRLIDKTLQKCRQMDDVSLQRLRKKSGELQA